MTFVPALKRMLAVPAVVLVVTACGGNSSSVPLSEAKKLSVSTSGISTACGLAFQATAFPGADKKDLETLEATAASSARKLASVYARNQAWIYQGVTVRQIVGESLSMLDTCGLTQAERTLAFAHHLPRRVVDRRDVISVERVPQAQRVRGDPGADRECSRRSQAVVLWHDDEDQNAEAEHVQANDHRRHRAGAAPLRARHRSNVPALAPPVQLVVIGITPVVVPVSTPRTERCHWWMLREDAGSDA